jgi:hypothetical protein
LTSVTLSEGVSSIATWAFGRNQLTSVTIPASAVTIEAGALMCNPNLRLIEVASENANDSALEGGSCNTDGTALQQWPAGKTSVNIPSSVTVIESNAFRENNLTSITIPESVTSIGDRAFAGNKITSITLPPSVKTIGRNAFADNTLTSITIGANVVLNGASLDSAFDDRYNYAWGFGKAAGTYAKQGNNWVRSAAAPAPAN